MTGNIFGIGTDMTSVSRFEKILVKHPTRLISRILTSIERENYLLSKTPARFLAKAFAAKEACVKAMGTGMRNGLSFQDIEITRDLQGKPIINLSGHAKQFQLTNNITSLHLSLSDEKDLVIAFVVLGK